MEKIKLDDFKNYYFLSNVKASKKNNHVAFVCSKVSDDLEGYDQNIYYYDGELKQVTTQNKGGDYIWFNDSSILYQSDKCDDYIEYSWINILDSSEKKVFKLPFSNGEIQRFSNKIVVSTKIDANDPDEYLNCERKEKNNDYQIIDEIPFYYNGQGFINKKRNALFIMNDFDSSSLKRITDPFTDVISWCCGDNKIYYLGDKYNTLHTRKPDLYCYDLQTHKTTTLYYSSLFLKSVSYTDGFLYIFGSDYQAHGKHQNLTLYKFDLEENEMSVFFDNQESTVNSVGSDCRYGKMKNIEADDGNMYYISTRLNSSYLYCVDSEGKDTCLFGNNGSVDDFSVGEHKIYYIGMSKNHLQELYCYDGLTKETIQCTNINERVLENKYVAQCKPISMTYHDDEIYGFVLEPYQYDKKKKYPAILTIHGGPNTVYGEVFFHDMQVWASQGYFVMYCNPYGSDGRGNEFMDIRGKYGTDDYEVLMKFTDEVLKKYPAIHPKKVCVTGGSYGGYMTNWMIGHTSRFACAVSQRSISNFISLAGVSDLGYRFSLDQNKVDNFQDHIDILWNHSPLKYAHLITTPTLFIHSDCDYRCPLEQSIQMVNALLINGIDTRLCWIKGENHELSRNGKPKQRIKRLEEMMNWLNQYTK